MVPTKGVCLNTLFETLTAWEAELKALEDEMPSVIEDEGDAS